MPIYGFDITVTDLQLSDEQRAVTRTEEFWHDVFPHTAHEEWYDAEGYRFVRIIGTLTVHHLALALDAISEMAKKGQATLGMTHRQTTGILIHIRDLEHPVLYPDAPTPLPPSGRSPTVGTS